MAQQANSSTATEQDDFAEANDEFASCYSGFSRMNSVTHEEPSTGGFGKEAPSNPDQVKVKLEQQTPPQQQQQQQQQQGGSRSQGGTRKAPPPKPEWERNLEKCCIIQ
mmetsp:Transcript_10333/g.28214  ORF Transcript_10333/g.28214 Transcript_10333/m.28214 type:complete len:108 (+) Transcript_10333:45-368(+)